MGKEANKGLRAYSEIAQWTIATLAVDKVKEILANGKDKELIVEIKINGIEVDFEKIVISINRQFDYAVKEKAKELISKTVGEEVSDITDILCDIKNVAEGLLESIDT